MNSKYAYIRLNVENYAACRCFYQDILGFQVCYASDAEEYAELDAGETKIAIHNRARVKELLSRVETVAEGSADAKVVLTFAVSNLGEEIAQLKAKGIVLVRSPCHYPEVEIHQGGLITACFRDPDGNLIEFEQSLS